MNICETNKTAQAKLDAATTKYEQEKAAEFDKDFALISQFDKYIEDVCYCLAGCAKPNAATEGMFPRIKGGRILLPSILSALCHAHAIESGLTYGDNPYSNRYGQFSDGSLGLNNYDIRNTKAMYHWQQTVLLPKLGEYTGRQYKEKHDGEMFGDYWLMPEDETYSEYMAYWKPAPYSLFFFPLIGQYYFLCFIVNIIYAAFTKKWSRG